MNGAWHAQVPQAFPLKCRNLPSLMQNGFAIPSPMLSTKLWNASKDKNGNFLALCSKATSIVPND